MIFHQPGNSLSGNNYNIFIHSIKHDFHFHKNPELIYIVKGNVECIIKDKKEILSEGDFGLCLSNEIHSYTPIGDSAYWVCVFSEDFVRSFTSMIKGKTGDRFKFDCEKTVRDYIEEKLIKEKNPSLFTLKSCLYAVCEQYLKSVNLVNVDKSKLQSMHIIIEFVEKNYASDIKLTDVAGILGYDYHYVSRYFHNLFNMPFKSFLNTYRLEKAVELIENSDKKMIEIAYESGFQSIRNFNDSFKKHYGITPNQYKSSRIIKYEELR